MAGLRTAFQVWNGLAPSEIGPMAIPLSFDFGAQASYDGDLFLEEANKQIDFVQSVYIDNADNPAQLILNIYPIGQRIIAFPNVQGWYPILSGDQTRFKVSTDLKAGLSCKLIFANVPMPTAVWYTV